ncbi:hypothetical protein POPTR_001G212300v4 [Populus trichocarpa]|jgi:hypothetical protein|uniref:Cyclin-dependent protein kinase inhibitor SMR2 n=1 Tax=Populus trichocarpa TaxID=3694 RepID=A0A3N7EB39_POPTR|nr:hypothetical protein POPTR_001G212300v4 [Populus trichocarpa]
MSEDHINQRDLPKLLQSAPQGHEQGEGELGLQAVDDQEECRTVPASSDHKIPTIQSCPPTPPSIDQAVDDQEECRTPTSSDHKIPTIRSCPPTPRKKVQVFAHKRKIPEFFDTTNKDEVESFFRSSFEVPSRVNQSRPMKRRCRSY